MVREGNPIMPPARPAPTTTISGKQLPAPDPKFGGVIKNDALQSKPWWAPRVMPPKGAPNVLLIITDDAGFGVPSTFGGVIPTPTMDRIANSGLRYNNIHSTALCSPTRAALITGRNHHSVGFGVISEQSTGFPGYNSIIPDDKATIGRILLDNGYATSWFGKDHNTPAFAASQVGPFDKWPTGMGFEYFYGFVGGDANQWQPNLFRNTTQIYPFDGKPGWNLITGMADDAIDYINRMHQTDPAKPIFIKYAPGATHAPHHPTKEWVDKIHAMHLFDDGYEKLRERIFENQKRLGVIARDSKLTPWPDDLLKSWDQLSAEEKKLFIRQVEIFAAYAAYNDHEIGRVIQVFEDLGRLDNTLVIYINGDNGTSAEGGPLGTPNEVAFFIGKRVRSNIRELEGALRRLVANAQFTGRPITMEFAREALRDLLAVQERKVTIDNIQKTVAEYYKIRVADLLSKSRSRMVTRPRQTAMALAKDLTNHSLPEIGDAFGGRDHTTVLHACKRIKELREADNRIREDFDNLLRILTT